MILVFMSENPKTRETLPASEQSAETGRETAEPSLEDLQKELSGLERDFRDLRERFDQAQSEIGALREKLEGAEKQAAAEEPERTEGVEAGYPTASAETEMTLEERAEKILAVTDQALAETFPSREFKLLTTDGSSCNVYAGDDGLIYKVGVMKGRDEMYDIRALEKSKAMADRGNYMANEAAKLDYLAQRGLAPKLVKYVNSRAAVAKRPWYRKIFRRQPEMAALPVLIMEKADFDPQDFAEMSVEAREAEAERITGIMEKDGKWAPGDTEPVVDKKTGRIIFVDAGGWLDAKKRKLDIRREIRSILELER